VSPREGDIPSARSAFRRIERRFHFRETDPISCVTCLGVSPKTTAPFDPPFSPRLASTRLEYPVE